MYIDEEKPCEMIETSSNAEKGRQPLQADKLTQIVKTQKSPVRRCLLLS
jgi:hypothetical protein